MHSRGFNSPNIHFHFVNFSTFFLTRVNKQKPNLRPTFGSNLSLFAISYYFRAFSNRSRHLDFFEKNKSVTFSFVWEYIGVSLFMNEL